MHRLLAALILLATALATTASVEVAQAQAASADSAVSAADIEQARKIIERLSPEQQAALTAMATKEGIPPEILLLRLAGSAVKSANLSDTGEDTPPPPPPPPPSDRRDKARRIIANLTAAEQNSLQELAAREGTAPEDLWITLLGTETVGANLAELGEDAAGKPSEADLERARQYILKLSPSEQAALRELAAKEGRSPEELLLSLFGSATLGASGSDIGEDDPGASSGTGGPPSGSGSSGGSGSSATGTAATTPGATSGSGAGTVTGATTGSAPKIKKKTIKKRKKKPVPPAN